MCRLSQDLGLNRWEYYLCLGEDVADSRRKLWWECYWWDKWYSATTGKQPLLNDDTTAFLLPKCVMELGVDDLMSCDALISTANLEHASVEAAVLFGYIALSRTVSTLFTGMLYNKKFTHYMVCSTQQGPFRLDTTVEELESTFLSAKATFGKLGDKFKLFFANNSGVNNVFELYIQMEYVRSSCFTAVGNLLLRFKSFLEKGRARGVERCLQESRKIVLSSSKEVLLKVLGVDTFYNVKSCVRAMLFIFLNVAGGIIGGQSREEDDHCILLLCSVTDHFNRALLVSSPTANTHQHGTKIRPNHSKSIFLVISRICLQVHLKRNGISESELLVTMKKADPRLAELCENLLNFGSELLGFFSADHERSAYHSAILKYLKMKTGDFATEESKTKTQDYNNAKRDSSMSLSDQTRKRQQEGPLGDQTNPPEFNTLESFLNLENFPELCSSFFEDMVNLEFSNGS